MGVSKNSGTPKSSILIGFSIIDHPFWGIPIFGNPQSICQVSCQKSAVIVGRFQPGKDWGYGYSSDVLGRLIEALQKTMEFLDELELRCGSWHDSMSTSFLLFEYWEIVTISFVFGIWYAGMEDQHFQIRKWSLESPWRSFFATKYWNLCDWLRPSFKCHWTGKTIWPRSTRENPGMGVVPCQALKWLISWRVSWKWQTCREWKGPRATQHMLLSYTHFISISCSESYWVPSGSASRQCAFFRQEGALCDSRCGWQWGLGECWPSSHRQAEDGYFLCVGLRQFCLLGRSDHHQAGPDGTSECWLRLILLWL